MRRLALCLAVISTVAITLAAPAAGSPASPVSYRPPLDAPIVDPFRPPPEDWAAGNRGVDFAPTKGTEVGAAAGGEVVFAGNVGGSLHVVVLHADGVRTSYSFLRSVAVKRGDTLAAGHIVGTSAELLHFGARIGEAYVDPTLLFGDSGSHVYLVPNADRRRLSEGDERSGLFKMLERTVARALDAAASGFDELKGLAHYVAQNYPLRFSAKGAEILKRWWDQRSRCTSADDEPPSPTARHLLVLVAGLGSSFSTDRDGKRNENGAVFEVDHASLGYAPSDVFKFSYLGGTVDEHPYDPEDTVVDIRQSARRLRELLADLADANPGVPVDIIAHSQGGLVARWAITEEFDDLDPRMPHVASLVTLGTPHHGADAATAAAMLGHTRAGRLMHQAAKPVVGFDPGATSVEQLAETSEFIRRLNERRLPPGVNVTSIGGRGDAVVPAPRTHVDGANNVVVSVSGVLGDHDGLPSAPAAYREIALALAGLPPTCQGFFDAMADGVVSEGISLLEDNLGAVAWAGARALDAANPFLAA